MMQDNASGLYADLTYQIIGILYEVHNELGAIHKENIYREAVAIELKSKKISFEKEKTVPVIYKGEKVGVYRPDFVIENKVILELKAVPAMTSVMYGPNILLCQRHFVSACSVSKFWNGKTYCKKENFYASK